MCCARTAVAAGAAVAVFGRYGAAEGRGKPTVATVGRTAAGGFTAVATEGAAAGFGAGTVCIHERV
jgi:hypothetical protein